MYSELFSKKYKLRSTPSGFIADSIPDTTRTGSTNILHKFFHYGIQFFFSTLYEEICFLLRKDIELRCTGSQTAAFISIRDMMKECEWKYIYDICQIAYFLIKKYEQKRSGAFGDNISNLFEEESLGYKFENGEINKIRPELLQSNINEARIILKGDEFKGADYQFEKAIKYLNLHPPDVENSCKDAIASIESVGRVIIGNKNALLDDIIKSLTRKRYYS